MSEVQVEAGAKVITLDNYGTAIYFIEQGHADVLTEGGQATQTLGPGARSVRSHSSSRESGRPAVMARTPMRLLRCPIRTSRASGPGA